MARFNGSAAGLKESCQLAGIGYDSRALVGVAQLVRASDCGSPAASTDQIALHPIAAKQFPQAISGDDSARRRSAVTPRPAAGVQIHDFIREFEETKRLVKLLADTASEVL